MPRTLYREAMLVRVLCLIGLTVMLAVPVAGAAPQQLATLPVPTGGFAIDLPTNWVGVTSESQSVLSRLEKVPAFKSFAQDGSLKLIAADPNTSGAVYMDTGAERIGTISLK